MTDDTSEFDIQFENEFILPNDFLFGSELGMLELPIDPVLTTFGRHLAFQCFMSSVEKEYEINNRAIDALCHKRKCAVVLRFENENDKNVYSYTLKDALSVSKRSTYMHEHAPLETDFIIYEEPDFKSQPQILDKMMKTDRVFVLCDSNVEFSEPIKNLVTASVTLKLTEAAIKTALNAFYNTNLLISADDMMAMMKLSATELSSVFKEKYALDKCMKVIAGLLKHKQENESVTVETLAEKLTKPIDGPTLSELHGLGAAGDWGHDLAADLKDFSNGEISWKDVDQGILIYGAPGTGKTTFAAALARTCNVNFIATSAAQWQANGHLGDYLKAMNAVFKRAEAAAPCILFIDEFDAIGDRNISSGENHSYDIKAINGLLEKLDGSEGRKGVVVVAATNNPQLIDPAFTRPGRLTKAVEIPLPDATVREGILRFHLKENLKNADLSAVVKHSEGMAGAWLEQLVRTAKRFSRRARRSMTLDDLLKSLPERLQLSDTFLKRIAFHEAGHIITALEHENTVLSASIKTTAPTTNVAESAGQVAIQYHNDTSAFMTKKDCLNLIVETLGGIASEEFFFSETTTGNVGDLRHATITAARMHIRYGFFDRLVFSNTNSDSDIFSLLSMRRDLELEVEKTLRECMTKAKAVIEKRQEDVELLTHALLEKHELSSEDITLLLTKNTTCVIH